MSGILAALAGIKTAIATAVDEYFNRVTLLLNTTSTNGAQNNTFLDSSSSPLTITRNGNTTQGTFTPFSQTGWSNYFDGSDDDLAIASDVKLTPAAGDFTLECWIYPTSWGGSGTYRAITAGPVSGCMFFGQTSTNFGLRALAVADIVVTSTLPTVNTWTHVAVSRSGTTARLFINGALAATATDSTNFPQTQFVIGNTSVGGSEEYSGYISNLRFVKGTAVYTSAFTPSTTPLTAVTNTQLLTCQSNRFIDNSTNAFSLSIGGTPSVQAFSPFLPTAAYDTAVVGGSGYFDGSGDYLSAASNAAFAFGTGDFELSFWFYPTVSSQDNFDKYFITGSSVGNFVVDQQSTANQIAVNDNNSVLVTSSSNLIPFSWNHVVISRVSTTLRIFLNGTQVGSVTNSTNFTQAGAFIGANNSGTNNVTGYFSGIRVVKGSGVSSVTVPTAPPTAITNTQLLLNFTNAGIYDSASKNVLETVGNAQVSTTQAKWGTTSMAFDGTGDTLNSSPSQVLSLGSGNWTIECWVRLNATGTETNIGQSKNYYTAGFNGNFVFRVGTSNLWRSFDGQSNQATIDGSFSWSTGVWYHVAWVRNSGTVTVYRDGTSLGSVSDSKTLSDSANGIILGSSLNAYIDDLRITVGLARYTTTFTPPTAAFPLQ